MEEALARAGEPAIGIRRGDGDRTDRGILAAELYASASPLRGPVVRTPQVSAARPEALRVPGIHDHGSDKEKVVVRVDSGNGLVGAGPAIGGLEDRQVRETGVKNVRVDRVDSHISGIARDQSLPGIWTRRLAPADHAVVLRAAEVGVALGIGQPVVELSHAITVVEARPHSPAGVWSAHLRLLRHG